MKCLALEESVQKLVECLKALPNFSKQILLLPMQNGVKSINIVEKEVKNIPNFTVLGGIVAYGVLWKDKACFHRSTEGYVYLEKPKATNEIFTEFVTALQKCCEVRATDKIGEIMYGKLIVNLINSVNALSDITVGHMLDDPYYRRIWGAAITEAISVFTKSGVPFASVMDLPIKRFPSLLGSSILWTLFKLVRKQDKTGYSSMAQDLQKNRATEIDFINGEVTDVAAANGLSAPINTKIIKLIKMMEENNSAGKKRTLRIPTSGKELAQQIGIPPKGLFCVDNIIVGTLLVVVYACYRMWF